jgi:hypothetical protein
MDCPVMSPEPFIRKYFMERAEIIGLGISYDMLLDALSDAEITIDIDGHGALRVIVPLYKLIIRMPEIPNGPRWYKSLDY